MAGDRGARDVPDAIAPTETPPSAGAAVGNGLAPGALVGGRFVIEDRLGAGGMGIVYRARDRVLERAVAVKVLQGHLGQDAHFMARFIHEAKIVAGLSSNPHVVALYDVGTQEDGAPYLVMELLVGRSLRDVLLHAREAESVHPDASPKLSPSGAEDGARPVRRLSRSWVIAMGRHVAAALYDAHAKGVTHRDLKPENVFVLEARTLPFLVKVLDFGLARSTSSPLPEPYATIPGALLGTPPYMAPEQIGGENGPASDIYSLGLMLYETAAGRSPYRARTPREWYTAHLAATPDPLPDEQPPYPATFGKLISHMLAKDPQSRPTAQRVLRDLSRIEEELDPTVSWLAASRKT